MNAPWDGVAAVAHAHGLALVRPRGAFDDRHYYVQLYVTADVIEQALRAAVTS